MTDTTRAVIITGGTSGVGLATALRLAGDGDTRIALIGRNTERGKEACTTVRAAGGLKHSAPRVLGLQNSGLLNEFIQPRSTMQTKPFLPSTAVS